MGYMSKPHSKAAWVVSIFSYGYAVLTPGIDLT